MNLRRSFAALSLAALTGTTVIAQTLPQGWDQAMAKAAPVAVRSVPVEITNGSLHSLTLTGAWELHGDHKRFGGFSGLHVSGQQLFAVSDHAWWFGAMLRDRDKVLSLANARLAPMRDGEGDTYNKAGGDAEGLTLRQTPQGARLMVSFERDQRLMALRETGRLGATIQPRSFEQFSTNKGLEAVATLPDGRLIVFAEGIDAAGIPMFLVGRDDEVSESRLPPISDHSVTGADIGPDGRLYLVLRAYSALFGVSIRVMRYSLGADGWPQPGSAETLAAFESDSGIDNMEGISLDRSDNGQTRLWLISDDNFRSTQRTLLLRFKVQP